MADILVVGSKVKEAVKAQNMNMAGDFAAGLSKEVEMMVKKACGRAQANGRKTVRASDV